MSICYLKLKYYNDAKENILLFINNNNDKNNDQAWGILGASLYGLNKKKESLCAYNKAYELKKKKIYNIMINKINTELNNESSENMYNVFSKNPKMNKLFESIMTDNNVLNNVSFQNKLMSLQSNPLEALKDPEIMNVMNNMIKKVF